jgi:hypothetical protein
MSCTATTFLLAALALHQLCHVPGLLTPYRVDSTSTTPRVRVPWLLTRPIIRIAPTLLRLCHASECAVFAAQLLVGRSHWLSTCVRSLRLAARLLVVRIAPALLRLCRASGRAVSTLDFSSVDRTGSRCASGHCISRHDYSSSELHMLYCAYAVHPDALSRRSTSRQSVTLALAVCPVILWCVVTTVSRSQRIYFTYVARLGASTRHAACRVAHRRLLRLCRASGCLDTSRSSSRGSSCCLWSTTSTMPRVWVPRHVAWLVTPLVVDYFDYAARLVAPLVVDYFDYAARLVAPFVVDYFDYAARPGSSAHCAAHHAARCAAHRRLLRLRHAFGCLGTSRVLSRGSSRHSSSTTSTTSRVRVPRHVAPLVTPLVVDYFDYAARSGASARRAARHAARRAARHRLLC